MVANILESPETKHVEFRENLSTIHFHNGGIYRILREYLSIRKIKAVYLYFSFGCPSMSILLFPFPNIRKKRTTYIFPQAIDKLDASLIRWRTKTWKLKDQKFMKLPFSFWFMWRFICIYFILNPTSAFSDFSPPFHVSFFSCLLKLTWMPHYILLNINNKIRQRHKTSCHTQELIWHS